MHSKKYLYELTYNHLREQILNCQLECGSRLPSIQQLANMYHVSTKTIRTVLRLLQEDGLILTRERQRAVVIHQAPFLKKECASIRSITRKRSAVLDIYRTMELLMPDILAFCSRFVKVYELTNYERAVKWIRRPVLTGSWQICSDIIHDVLLSSGNFLFSSMYKSLEIYAEMPFLAEYQRFVTGYTPFIETHHVDWILDSLQLNSAAIQRRFAEHFRQNYQAIEKSFHLLSALHPDAEDEDIPAFTWEAKWGWDLLYKKVGRDLIDKIGTGVYPPGRLLPSEACMMKEYGVSLSTIRRALRVLQELGFIETCNGRGSIALAHKNWRIQSTTHNPEYQEDTFVYLCALQLNTFLIRPAAALTYDHLDSAALQELQDHLLHSPQSHLKAWMDCILPRVPLHPLRVILEQTNEILNWGYFYSFYSGASSNMQRLNKLGLLALSSLQNDNREGFVNSLCDGYLYLFQTIRSYLLQNGYTQAEQLALPRRI
ncbi:GntR family transcriptional regulator [Ruminococcus gauvreauii]|uniref:GntR family transcriptional regulator n=1 Tax=Ruminococcus gauvreauii TaxID=438033 RepID=UPI003984544C